jgi:hypothetical protein
MRLFASSLTGSARTWINGLPSGSIKTPEDLERAFKNRWCKKESMASFYSQYLEFAKEPMKTLGNSMIGSTFSLANFNPTFTQRVLFSNIT